MDNMYSLHVTYATAAHEPTTFLDTVHEAYCGPVLLAHQGTRHELHVATQTPTLA